jgi:hypothetical protein
MLKEMDLTGIMDHAVQRHSEAACAGILTVNGLDGYLVCPTCQGTERRHLASAAKRKTK